MLPSLSAAADSGRASETKKPGISTAAISRAITTPTSSATGKCFQKPTRSDAVSTSSIITTNRNSTITAPT